MLITHNRKLRFKGIRVPSRILIFRFSENFLFPKSHSFKNSSLERNLNTCIVYFVNVINVTSNCQEYDILIEYDKRPRPGSIRIFPDKL